MEYVITPPEVVSIAVVGRSERFPVRRIYCVGRNYMAHIREMGGDERDPPSRATSRDSRPGRASRRRRRTSRSPAWGAARADAERRWSHRGPSPHGSWSHPRRVTRSSAGLRSTVPGSTARSRDRRTRSAPVHGPSVGRRGSRPQPHRPPCHQDQLQRGQ